MKDEYIHRGYLFDAINRKAQKAIDQGQTVYAAGLTDALSIVTHFPAAHVELIGFNDGESGTKMTKNEKSTSWEWEYDGEND